MTRHELGTVCVQGGWRPKNGEPCQLIGIGKTLLERKLSGVFEHRVVRRSSMLFRGCDDVFRIPHSRHTTIDGEAVRAIMGAGLEAVSLSVNDLGTLPRRAAAVRALAGA